MSSGVLVLRALGIGDLLTAVPALRGLRQAYPDERLVLAAPEWLRDLVELVDAVDELLPTPGLGALRWPGPPPRLAVNLHGRGPESIRDLRATRPAGLLTHRHPAVPEVPGPDWDPDRHEVDRWCRLLEYGHVAAGRGDLHLPPPPGPSPAPGAVVIHPGAAYPARRWPPERFAAVAKALAAEGHRVVLTGGESEKDLAQEVAAAAGLGADTVLAGTTGLADLAALVSGAALVLCGDTGLGHLATAFGTPSVLLFGPTPPRRWGPPPDASQHVVLWVGDVGDPHGAEPDAGLLLLGEENVLSAVRSGLREEVRHG
ncbi:glycosyltransferase family 9 protein [Amycolatopsis jiangsuensis]|uniref:ADP-heptose:LPS heptosyltransferase n=1 Tax=Amycolatopsis jiangsuensis TaxID=1181879 RepID=A0A840J634_9PSEU|nr:glycosyltransferase family 9 protein [Amycolatopsis jiangsuensis]MBB4689149.1 ADP-heptose:LPS heptosyltransferase [Amycolatopsis jiangsuensis]